MAATEDLYVKDFYFKGADLLHSFIGKDGFSGLYLPLNSCHMAVLHVKGPVLVVIYQAIHFELVAEDQPGYTKRQY
uniref:Uncharacterized protein n=1 Tax=Oryza brachyantha TaxID=4533 RepID=J3LCM8_ORYBR